MPPLRIIPATPDLVPFLVDRIAAEERAALFRHAGREQTIRNIKAALRQSARSWCAMDGGGVVFLAAAYRPDRRAPAILWGIHTAAVRLHLRESLRGFRVILAEATAAFGGVTLDVPAFPSSIRRVRRAGFTIGAPFDVDGRGAMVCRCSRPQSGEGGLHHG